MQVVLRNRVVTVPLIVLTVVFAAYWLIRTQQKTPLPIPTLTPQLASQISAYLNSPTLRNIYNKFFEMPYTEYDQMLLNHIRSFITKPSREPPTLRQPDREDHSQFRQSMSIDKLFGDRRNGFFVECGAADGEIFSNSLLFERSRNWTGLLVEANPVYYDSLEKKNRNAYVLKACLSTERRPQKVWFSMQDMLSGITVIKKYNSFQIACLPLNSILAALNVTHVDFVSLDVEGAELDILRTIDWSRFRIDVFMIEYNIIRKNLEALRKFFKGTKLYREVGTLAKQQDVVFIRKDMKAFHVDDFESESLWYRILNVLGF